MTPARHLSLTAVLSTTLALTAGCTEESAGSPMPDNTVNISSTTESAPSSERPAERPREIALDGRDPCGLVPQTDWPKFGIEGPGKESEEPNFASPNCYYPSVGDVTLVVTEGMAAWANRTENTEISAAEAIEEFPTITIWNEVDRRSCYTAVDVADGQHLLITASSVNASVDREATCDRSYQLAESVMTALVGP